MFKPLPITVSVQKAIQLYQPLVAMAYSNSRRLFDQRIANQRL
jgi:hypothetical protein